MKRFLVPGFFFPMANVFNFSQGNSIVASLIAFANLLICMLLIGLPKSLLKARLPDAMRVTALFVLANSAVLLTQYASGEERALFPGLAALLFGIGNLLQSSAFVTRHAWQTRIIVSLLHPAIWYGLGYTMTAIAIGGGIPFLVRPLADKLSLGLIVIGVSETLAACCLLASGRITNLAIPFVIVACGTACFALTGAITGNSLGLMTGLFACAGELSLAVLMQKRQRPTNGIIDAD